MSTTFGVRVPGYENGPDEDPEVTEVAFRGNGGRIRLKNALVLMLPDDTELIALDNSNQGLATIADLRKEYEEQLNS